MSSPPVQIQWSLNETSQSVFSVLRGVLTAATSDNVQVLAILACDRFGNTIAMSNETVLMVGSILVPSPEPATIRFLKGLVGFFPNDCATQLGTSSAGIRFLGLAAAIVTTIGTLNSAKALDIMLRSSATDLTMSPTVGHLKDLLGSLEARSYRCGFADSVVGWQMILRREILPFISSGVLRQTLDEKSLRVPSPETIAGIVEAFREVARMGSSTVIGVTIKVSEAAPWILAFAQWCLDIPPSLHVEGIAVAIRKQSQSRVTIIIVNSSSKPVEVIIHHQLEDFTQLLGPSSRHFTSGMVTIESYYPWLLQQLGFEDDTMFRLLRQALEHSIPQVLSAMKCGRFAHLGQSIASEHFLGSISNSEATSYLSPLPDIKTIAQIYAKALALEGPVHFVTLRPGMLIADLPLVSRHLESLMKRCPCEQCCKSTQRYAEQIPSNEFCYRRNFFRSLAFIITEILVLSLFESSTPLLVRLSLERQRGGPALDRHISKVIETGSIQNFEDMELLEWARGMVGHVFDDEDRSLLLTSGKGQVIYPVIFDTLYIEKQGYLKLYCLKGTLRYQNDTYNVVSAPEDDEDINGNTHLRLPSYPNVSQPLNLFKDFKLSWKVTIQDNKELHVKVMLCSSSDVSFVVENDPLLILLSLKDTLLLERCPHNRHAQLATTSQFSFYISPWSLNEAISNSTSQVGIVPVDGADDLRCFAIACQDASVLRRNSCLQCCLNLCRDTGIQTLVL